MGKRTVDVEAYVTSPALARTCVSAVSQWRPLSDFSCIVDPSAGSGAFLDLLPEDRRIGVDIRPPRSDVIEADFLAWSPGPASGPILVIGNPPFGQRGALAVRFVAHAATFAEAIAFILPRSFNKETFQNRVPADFHLRHSMACDDAFLVDGRPQHVKTVFQIWERAATPRPRVVRPRAHPHFTMRHAHLSRTTPQERERLCAEHPFAIPQVGTSFAPRDAQGLSRGSHWFIRPVVPAVRDVFAVLDFGFLTDMNTAHTSLAQADIVQAYAAALEAHPRLGTAIRAQLSSAGEA